MPPFGIRSPAFAPRITVSTEEANDSVDAAATPAEPRPNDSADIADRAADDAPILASTVSAPIAAIAPAAIPASTPMASSPTIGMNASNPRPRSPSHFKSRRDCQHIMAIARLSSAIDMLTSSMVLLHLSLHLSLPLHFSYLRICRIAAVRFKFDNDALIIKWRCGVVKLGQWIFSLAVEAYNVIAVLNRRVKGLANVS